MYYQTLRKKFNLPRAQLDPAMIRVVRREIQRQKIEVIRANKNILQELADVCRDIEENGLPSNLVCARLPKGMGYGIFLDPNAKPILKGQLIGPYSGVVSILPQNVSSDTAYAFAPIVDILLSKEEQRLFDPKNGYHPKRLYSLDVDAERKGNFIRFINHSEKPNIVAHLFNIPKNRYGLLPSPIEVLYLAKKTIRPGEQLLVSYEGDGDSYWKNLKIRPIPITPQTFRVSSKKCEKTNSKDL